MKIRKVEGLGEVVSAACKTLAVLGTGKERVDLHLMLTLGSSVVRYSDDSVGEWDKHKAACLMVTDALRNVMYYQSLNWKQYMYLLEMFDVLVAHTDARVKELRQMKDARSELAEALASGQVVL